MPTDLEARLARLEQAGHRWRWGCAALACALLLVTGLAMQAEFQDNTVRTNSLTEASESVSDGEGFAVFVRRDGNVVIVHADGTVIRTSNQPMVVDF